MNFCSNCGVKTSGNPKFCPQCGQSVSGVSAANQSTQRQHDTQPPISDSHLLGKADGQSTERKLYGGSSESQWRLLFSLS